MDEILHYFPNLTAKQIEQFAALHELYIKWNSMINVISRKDIENLYAHHVLHSLSIAKFVRFQPNTKVLDFGTGGGFPGIPLAIMFPDVSFKMIDGTGKKIQVVREISAAIGLHNTRPEHLRGENEKGTYDFIVSRAVMPLPDIVRLMKKNISKQQFNAIANGIITLKGGNLAEELKQYKNIVEQEPVGQWFDGEWFEEKYLVYLPC